MWKLKENDLHLLYISTEDTHTVPVVISGTYEDYMVGLTREDAIKLLDSGLVKTSKALEKKLRKGG